MADSTLVDPEDAVAVPNEVLYHPRLSRSAKLLYMYLLYYADGAPSVAPGYERLIDDLQSGRAQVARWLKQLRDAKVISVRRPGLGQPAVFILRPDEVAPELLDPPKPRKRRTRTWRDKAALYLRDQGICGICGQHVHPDDISVDHIVPVSRGGSDDDDNIQLAHVTCNKRKGNRV